MVDLSQCVQGLESLIGTIRANLDEAGKALDEYQLGVAPENARELCVENLRQVRGSLIIGGCQGGTLLCEELEAVVLSLPVGSAKPPSGKMIDVLRRSIAQVPRYVTACISDRREMLYTQLAWVNDLRAARNQHLATESYFFAPDLSVLDTLTTITDVRLLREKSRREFIHKLNQLYQFALLALAKGEHEDENLKKMAKVAFRFAEIFAGNRLEPLWRVAQAILTSSTGAELARSPALIGLMWDLDACIRKLASGGIEALDEDYPFSLLKNLLYYASIVDSDTSPAIADIQREFKLELAFPAITANLLRGGLTPYYEPEIRQNLLNHIATEIDKLKSCLISLDKTATGPATLRASPTTQIKDHLTNVADSLAVLGQLQLWRQITQLTKDFDAGLLDSEVLLADLILPTISQVENIETSLEHWLENYKPAAIAADNFTRGEISEGSDQRSGLENILQTIDALKDAIETRSDAGFDSDQQKNLRKLAESMETGLTEAGLSRPAIISKAIGKYISLELVDGGRLVDREVIARLADAIAGLEYFIALTAGNSKSDNRYLLDYAEAPLAERGLITESPPLPEEAGAEPEAGLSVEHDGVLTRLEPVEEDDSDEIDEEIIEIFIEEAQEIIESLQQTYPDWLKTKEDTKTLGDVRRSFHSLKGSGRMVNATFIGELGFAIETLFNKVIEGKLQFDQSCQSLVDNVINSLPVMVRDFKAKQQNDDGGFIDALIGAARAIIQGEAIRDVPGPLPQDYRAEPPDASLIGEELSSEILGEESATADTALDVVETSLFEGTTGQASLDEVTSESEETEALAAGDGLDEEVFEASLGDADIGDNQKIEETGASAGDQGFESKHGEEDTDFDQPRDDQDPEIIAIFVEEAEELLEQIEQALESWRENPGDRSQHEIVTRQLHTFKGGARVAGFKVLGDLSHEMESYIESRSALENLDEAFYATLLERYDELVGRFSLDRTGIMGSAQIVPDTGSAEAAALNIGEVRGVSAGQNKAETQPMESVGEPARVIPLDGYRQMTAKPPGRNTESAPAELQEMIKISASAIDNLVNLADETSITRGRIERRLNEFNRSLGEMDVTIARLRNQVRRMGIETEAQVLYRRGGSRRSEESSDFDPLELDRYSQLHQLSRALQESASDLQEVKNTLLDEIKSTEFLLLQQAQINKDLQENLMLTRLVPFNRLVPRLRKVVRQVSKDLAKPVNLQVLNAEGEMDRRVLGKIVGPLEHMIRNAVDHGIEDSPARRREKGKPDEGNLVVSFGRDGGDITISVADDGKGLDVDAIRGRAISRGLIGSDSQISEQELLQLIFIPGFSTSTTVSQISGRGVGLDVVASEVHELGGSVAISSIPGAGTQFNIRLPFTVSVNAALMVRSRLERYAIPLNAISGIVSISSAELDEYRRDSAKKLHYSGAEYSVRLLSELLNEEGGTPATPGGKVPLVLITVEHLRYAVGVESLEGSQEIIIKSLGPMLNKLVGLSGATVMGDGKVVVIIDLAALLRLKGQAHLATIDSILAAELAPVESGIFGAVELNDGLGESRQKASAKNGVKTVMVVDDSVTVRKVMSRFLEREGFRVVIAKDGVEAVSILHDVHPDLMLLDIEMPRMDGFDVARFVRNDSDVSELPIIMISSRSGQKHRDKALSCGVEYFLGKPYREDELLTVMRAIFDG